MNDSLRIWLNRTYAENAFFIGLLRSNPDGRPVTVHATHVDPDSPVLRAADVPGLEPDGLSAAAYVEFALDHCARHGIQLFLPRLHQHAVALRREDFAELGTTVLTPPAEAIELFADKAAAYLALAEAGLPVPPWWRVRDAAGLVAAVEQIEAAGDTPCLKPVTGAGGEGFRVLTRTPFNLSRLAGSPSWHVTLDHVVQALEAAEADGRSHPVDWLVMPHLAGPEVSVDCLGAPDGSLRAAVGRTKDGRRRGFTLDSAYLEPAQLLAETFGLSFLTNIQFRHHGGVPVLLDINTRPSGGLHQVSRCGLNLPWAAMLLALDEHPGDLAVHRLGDDYTLISTPYPALGPSHLLTPPTSLPIPGQRAVTESEENTAEAGAAASSAVG
ncbi:ATP-grasp domain-containing protein [Streptacidiphilus rugosus]|uniref:ATP-grasp domain-containing protein n=1 Tax=Streptacidiphilus rugosus TaxID=405783 RepID=UPI0005699C42|nr:ATP-grasp domain-containing protein [Streptacidiphilus rugosus]